MRHRIHILFALAVLFGLFISCSQLGLNILFKDSLLSLHQDDIEAGSRFYTMKFNHKVGWVDDETKTFTLTIGNSVPISSLSNPDLDAVISSDKLKIYIMYTNAGIQRGDTVKIEIQEGILQLENGSSVASLTITKEAVEDTTGPEVVPYIIDIPLKQNMEEVVVIFKESIKFYSVPIKDKIDEYVTLTLDNTPLKIKWVSIQERLGTPINNNTLVFELDRPLDPGTLSVVIENKVIKDQYSNPNKLISFEINVITPPFVNIGAVSGLIPADGSSKSDTMPTFSWNAVSGATGYEVQIAESQAGVENAVPVEASAASYTPTTALTNLQTHYWRVRAKDGVGQHGTWSTINSLLVNWGAVSGLSPANGSATTDTMPTFSWNAVSGATGYEVQIAGSEEGLDRAQAVVASAASYTPSTALTNNQTHYWRVRAKDGDGQYGAWSGIQSLEVIISLLLETVYVEGGSFQMGSTEGDSDERPVHDVTVSSFSMAKTEVTQGLWKAVMGSNPSYFKGDDLPVESVTWYEAVAYCNALSAKEGLDKVYTINKTAVTADFNKNGWRLPTEAEWEYASRGGKVSEGYMYSGSDTVEDVGWYSGNSTSRTHFVGEKAANELGLYDMSGNVSEWCWDWYGNYSNVSQSDPRGPLRALTGARVRRGGSWTNEAPDLRSAKRSGLTPGASYSDVGFRPVCLKQF